MIRKLLSGVFLLTGISVGRWRIGRATRQAVLLSGTALLLRSSSTQLRLRS